MNRIQDDVFELTRKLIGAINIYRILLYTLISAAMLVLVLGIFGLLTLPMAILSFAISFIYSFLRDMTISKYSAKQMDKYYAYANEKFKQLELYIPLLEKTFQGYFLKRAALVIDNGALYLEAFRQKKNQKQQQISISVPYGKAFIIDYENTDKNMKSITMDSTFSGQYYRFSIVNHEDVLKYINQAKKGGK